MQVIKNADFSREIDISAYIYLSEVAGVRKIEFDVIMNSYDGEKKIETIKEVRYITGVGLKEAKDLVEGKMPVTLATVQSKEKAEEIKERFIAIGASIDVL
ncbi:MAG: ribosomal protein L7/L12 [Bacteroidales bacterium]|jgi:large subunit ribosomal protein L7/L12|nr:ribosomal protein L7/L12 [Bacteroidales bacterium]